MIIDATNLILGRLATFAAKRTLLGENIDIINCEKAIITGRKKEMIERYKTKYNRGVPSQGPYISRMPDRIVRRTIRGMLPYKQVKGRAAFKRVMCYIGVPPNLADKKTEKVKPANIAKLSNTKYITIKELCKELGAKI